MGNTRRLVELILLRRRKQRTGVILGSRIKTEVIMFLPLTPMQRFRYNRLLTRMEMALPRATSPDRRRRSFPTMGSSARMLPMTPN